MREQQNKHSELRTAECAGVVSGRWFMTSGVSGLLVLTIFSITAFYLDESELDGAIANPLAAAQKDDYPPGELGKVVRLGEQLVKETDQHPLTKPFVGNSLKCTSCHLDAGRHPRAGSFIGVAAAYPAYSPREETVITLEDRILNCFIRSQNGTRPANGSKVPVAIAAYITWLSQGTPLKMNSAQPLGPNHLEMLNEQNVAPNKERGKTLYADLCASCHLDNGSGSPDGPPVWGNDSFNDGAGLSKVPKMAAWLKVAMPLDDANLTDQEAFDIAAYVNSNVRPKFTPAKPK